MHTLSVGNAFRPAIVGIGIFLAFASCMAALAGAMLIWPGTVPDKLWTLNETAHVELRKAGPYFGPLFWTLSIVLIVTAAGWFRQHAWAFRLTAAIICVQLAGDLVNLLRGDFVRGAAGIVIAGALLSYLLLSRIRTAFH